MRLRALKSSIVQDIFVRTADENYVAARWCNANALYTDFLWLALHATEKYLKAVLLMNGRSAKNDRSAKAFSHDISRLCAEAKDLVGALLPDRLPKPDKLNVSFWIDRTTDEFIAHLMKFGNADNRYLIHGYYTLSQDLHMLDQLVWAVRRLVIPLDERIGLDGKRRLPTYREILTRQPDYCPNLGMMPLDEIVRAEEDTPLRLAALNLNFSFAPPDFRHMPMRGGSASFNPVIFRRIFEPLAEGGPDQVLEVSQLANWLIQNVKLPHDVINKIKGAVTKAKEQHGLS